MNRSCGECTECCKGILNITVNDVTYSDGNNCTYCTSKGCKQYSKRPQDCIEYNCGWLKDTEIPDWMRPDKSGVFINDSTKDTVVYKGKAVPYIVPINNSINNNVMDYLVNRAISRNEPFRYIHKPNENTISIGAFGDGNFKLFVKKLGLPKG